MSREVRRGEVISDTHGFTDIETVRGFVLLGYSQFIIPVGIELALWRLLIVNNTINILVELYSTLLFARR